MIEFQVTQKIFTLIMKNKSETPTKMTLTEKLKLFGVKGIEVDESAIDENIKKHFTKKQTFSESAMNVVERLKEFGFDKFPH